MEYMEIGKIVNTQGLKGDLRIIPATDDIKRFELLDTVYVVFKNKQDELEIESIWYNKQFVIIKFKGINDINEAERYKGYSIKIPRSLSLPLSENEYYIGDLIGMKVLTVEGEFLGTVEDILFTGANDVYVIKDSLTKKEILIPAIKQCIINVDTKNKKMAVNLLEGLR